MITASSTDEAWYVVAQALCACVTAALPNTRGGMVDRVCCAVPGGIAWDACECGQLAISVGDSFYSDAFPAPATGQPQNACGPTYWAAPVTVELGPDGGAVGGEGGWLAGDVVGRRAADHQELNARLGVVEILGGGDA